MILAGRGVNDSMADWVAGQIHEARGGKPGTLLMLGLTFKEDVPDLRNSKVADLVAALSKLGHAVTVHDPMADPAEAQSEYDLTLDADGLSGQYDTVVLAVAHKAYLDLGLEALQDMRSEGGNLCDLKGALGGAGDWSL